MSLSDFWWICVFHHTPPLSSAFCISQESPGQRRCQWIRTGLQFIQQPPPSGRTPSPSLWGWVTLWREAFLQRRRATWSSSRSDPTLQHRHPCRHRSATNIHVLATCLVWFSLIPLVICCVCLSVSHLCVWTFTTGYIYSDQFIVAAQRCRADGALFALLRSSVAVPRLLSCCVQTPAAPSGLEPLADPLLAPITAGALPCHLTTLISFPCACHEELNCYALLTYVCCFGLFTLFFFLPDAGLKRFFFPTLFKILFKTSALWTQS